MNRPKTVLIGMHSAFLEDVASFFRSQAYIITEAKTLDEMMQRMGLVSSTSAAEPTITYGWYVMDVNLGFPTEDIIQPAATIYHYVKQDTQAQFMTLTQRTNVLEAATKAEIPIIYRAHITTLMDLVKAA